MTATRSDLLGICNDQGVPLDDFKRAFCDRCMQHECTRSRVGTSKFEQRVTDWNEKLFVNPLRLDPNDPRFPSITGQKFIMIDPSPPPEIRTGASAWIDPRDMSDQNPTAPAPKPVTTAAHPTPAAPAERKDLARVTTMNTPLQAPRMLGNAEKAPPPKADPWVGSETPAVPGEQVLKPGAKIRFGGGSGSGV